jgi:hypothetical protein
LPQTEFTTKLEVIFLDACRPPPPRGGGRHLSSFDSRSQLEPIPPSTSVEGAAAIITREVTSWDGVTAHQHRFGGVEFQAGGRELGHLHGDRLADLLLPHAEHDRAIAAGRARPHHVLPDSNWVSVYIQRPEQVQDVIELLRIAYQRAVTRPLHSRRS